MKTRLTIGARVRRNPLVWTDERYGVDANHGTVVALLTERGRMTSAVVQFDDGGQEMPYLPRTLELLPPNEAACEERAFKREVAELPGWARLQRRREPRED